MNKRTFTVEIDDSDYETPLSETELEDSLRLGFYEKGLGNISILSVEKQIVEQTVERPQNKTIQLLEKAESVLSDSEHRYHWVVSQELRNHLDEIHEKVE